MNQELLLFIMKALLTLLVATLTGIIYISSRSQKQLEKVTTSYQVILIAMVVGVVLSAGLNLLIGTLEESLQSEIRKWICVLLAGINAGYWSISLNPAPSRKELMAKGFKWALIAMITTAVILILLEKL